MHLMPPESGFIKLYTHYFLIFLDQLIVAVCYPYNSTLACTTSLSRLLEPCTVKLFLRKLRTKLLRTKFVRSQFSTKLTETIYGSVNFLCSYGSVKFYSIGPWLSFLGKMNWQPSLISETD